MRHVSVVAAALLLFTKGLPAQRTRLEAGVGLAAPTALRLPERFEERGFGPRLDVALSGGVGEGLLKWRVAAAGQRIKAGRDYLLTLSVPAGFGVDLSRGSVIPTVDLALAPHWTRYSRDFALACRVPQLGGQNGFGSSAAPPCSQNKLGVGVSGALGVRFVSANRPAIGVELQATHLPGVSTGVAGLVRISP